MAELADALDLGSSVNDVGVRVSLSAPEKRQILTEICRFFIHATGLVWNHALAYMA